MTILTRAGDEAVEIRRSLAWMIVSCLLFALVMVSVKLF